MDRRDISRVLLGSAAGAALLSERAAAQTCVAPCYPRTPAEIAANVTPLNYAIPSHAACGYAIVERYGTNAAPGTTDMTTAAQAAVKVALQAKSNVGVITSCRLSGSVNIDRLVDAAFDSYFRIVGLGEQAGFYASSAINMFSTTIAFTTAPVTQLVRFEDLNFEASGTNFDAYVLDDAKYLRTTFTGCNFVRIKCLTVASVYTHTQSIYFDHCNMRRWTGVFFNGAGSANFDIKFTNCLLEAGQAGVVLNQAVGCKFVSHTHEGSEDDTAIKVNGSQALYIQGYFEGNHRDLDLTAGAHLGVTVTASQFNSTTSGAENVWWGVAEACVSLGNYSSSRLHKLTSASKVTIRDYAVTAVTNRPGQSELPYNVPVLDAYTSADQPVTTSAFTRCALNAVVIDTNANFADGKFTATITGYYSFNCKINVKAVGGTVTRGIVSIFKNGVEAHRLVDVPLSLAAGNSAILCGGAELLVNATDYVEMFGYITGAGTPAFGFNAPAEATRFSGNYLRSAGV